MMSETRKSSLRPILSVGVAGVMIGTFGCAVGPDYAAPKLGMPEQFSSAAALGALRTSGSASIRDSEAGEAPSVAHAGWWKRFEDETLNTLVERALAENKDIDTALAKVKESRELLGAAASDLRPGSAGRLQYESNSSSGVRFPGDKQERITYEVWTAAIDFLWEIDLFGRLRRAEEARDAEMSRSIADADDAVRMVVSEVVMTYLQFRSAEEQSTVLQQSIQTQLDSVHMVNTQHDAGSASELDVARSTAQLNQIRAQLPPVEKARSLAIFRLAVLTGARPDSLVAELTDRRSLPRFHGTVEVESPVLLLRRRPDLRAAERNLAAMTASIGIAEGELYPVITFEGTLGAEATSPERWFSGGAGTYNLLPKIFWKPFDNGKLHALVRAADARAEQALKQYEQSVLKALEETESALVSYGSANQSYTDFVAASAASGRALELARVEYSVGSKDYLTVLEAQRTHLDIELGRVRAVADRELALVDVFRAFGGGWEPGAAVAELAKAEE